MNAAMKSDEGNTIGGSAQLYGPTVQAGSVQGGIHLYTAAGSAPAPAPSQLLPVPAHFTDRYDDLAALNTLAADGSAERAQDGTTAGGEDGTAGGSPQRLIVVSGPAGVGKTTLVSRWLHSLGPDFPDGQFYADLRGHTAGDPAGPAEILGQFLRALGVRSAPVEPAELASLWRSVSAGLRIAVMLDNAFTAAQVRPMLPGGPAGLVVVTSRRRLPGLRLDGARFYPLDVLGTAAGVELLIRGIGERRVANEPRAAHKVVALCAGLPLAVCLASARLAARPGQPLETLAFALAQDSGRLAALEIEGEGEATVRNALDASYAVLSTDSALLYRRLGALPVRTFDAWTAAAACAESLEWAERRLDELIEANLVEDIGPATCRFHDLVRIHAQDRAAADDTAPVRERALRQVCDWYLRTVTSVQEQLTPAQFTLPRTYGTPAPPALPLPYAADDAAALGWLDAQRMNVMAVVRAAADHEWHATTWQLVDAAWPLFLRLRHYDVWITAHEIGLEAARHDGHREAERQMLNSGAIGLSAAGRIEDAVGWYGASLRAARDAGDVRDEGQALLGLGACHFQAGRPAEAVPQLNRAITVWEDCGYPRGAALARIVLGEIALAGDSHSVAVAHFARAHDTLLAVPDPHDAARALAFLGRARAAGGEFAAGTEQLQQALAVFTSSSAVHWQARTLEMLGDSALGYAAEGTGGERAAAREFYARALALYETTSPADALRLGRLTASLDRTRPPSGDSGSQDPSP